MDNFLKFLLDNMLERNISGSTKPENIATISTAFVAKKYIPAYSASISSCDENGVLVMT